MYYVDLTLRDGTNLQQAIQMAKEIDQQSKAIGFNQTALDQMARQGFTKGEFESNWQGEYEFMKEFDSIEIALNQKNDSSESEFINDLKETSKDIKHIENKDVF